MEAFLRNKIEMWKVNGSWTWEEGGKIGCNMNIYMLLGDIYYIKIVYIYKWV
jgi:hypothetical protein